MSNPENFIDEVTDEVRRDRFFSILRRYGWILGLAVLAAIGFAGWHEWRKAAGQETAQQFGDALTLALESPQAAGSLQEIAAHEPAPRAALATMLAAAASASDPAARATLAAQLGTAAADRSLPGPWRDLARLKQIVLAGAAMPISERQAALDELARPGAPFRPLALEQLALLSLEKGETEAAVTALQALQQEPELTAGLQRRVVQLLVALGAAPAAG